MTSSHGLRLNDNGPFLVWKPDNLIVSHPIVTKLKMIDNMESVTNSIWRRHHTGHGSLIFGENGLFSVWKRDNLIFSHPNVTKLNLKTSLLTSRSIDYWLNLWKFMLQGIFDPFRVWRLFKLTPTILNSNHLSFPLSLTHFKIPSRMAVTARNVSPNYFFQAHLLLLT